MSSFQCATSSSDVNFFPHFGRTYSPFLLPFHSLDAASIASTEVFHALAALLKEKSLATSVGDEGGFAPDLGSDEEAIEYILEAVKKAGYEPGKDFVLAMDAASSEWKGSQKGEYVLPKCGKKFTSSELVEHWKNLIEKYPIYSIEDGLDEEDWEG